MADEDKGRVIGKDGRIAQAIRTVMRAAAGESSRRVALGHHLTQVTVSPGGSAAQKRVQSQRIRRAGLLLGRVRGRLMACGANCG